MSTHRRRGLLLAGAALALVATFARPGFELERPRVEHVVVFDVTQSMNVPDERLDGHPVSRLAYAKAALHRAIEALPCGSRLGWAIFTEYRSYLLFAPVEVCLHRAELRSTLAAIDNRMAWAGQSEVAKGLHSAIVVAKALPGVPSLVFVSDGHEAPPLHPRHRPAFDDKPGEVAGLVIGVGALTPAPIPKNDPLGRPLGVWGIDEVLQTDLYSRGRDGSASAEAMVDPGDAPVAGALGATPGSEHLSSLREAYLRQLAGENGFAFLHPRHADELVAALQAPALARPVPTRVDARLGLSALALALLLSSWWPAWRWWRPAGPRP